MVCLLREGRNTYATPPLLPGVCMRLIDLMLRGLSGQCPVMGYSPRESRAQELALCRGCHFRQSIA